MDNLINFLLHIDKYLNIVIQSFGNWTYGILFLIIFCETGLVFTPFLPGDSLIFATGALAAIGTLNLFYLWLILFLGAVLGDTVNYWIGHTFGEKLLAKEKLPLIKKEHIEKTQSFYAKHGGKTIILARFIPIIRTFAPFVAGIGKMSYAKFISFNIIGGFVWVSLFVFAGYFFGNLPSVKHNFTLVIILIILISVLPGLVEFIKHKQAKISPSTSE